jgi:hypothetical protein
VPIACGGPMQSLAGPTAATVMVLPRLEDQTDPHRGPPLQAGPRQKALPPAGRMASAADLVAPAPQVALLRLENVATQ